MKINSNHSNAAFNREIYTVHQWLQSRVFDMSGYPASVFRDRLTQYFADIGHYPYAATVKSLLSTNEDCFPVSGAKVHCDRSTLEIGSGQVFLSLKQWLLCLVEFFAHWSYCLASILTPKRTEGIGTPAVLVHGIGEESLFHNGSDQQFVKYCTHGPIAPLRDGRRFYIQSARVNAETSSYGFFYVRNPLLALLGESTLGGGGRLRLVLAHVRVFLAYTTATFRLRPLALLRKEFSYAAIAAELDRQQLIESVVLTCSSYTGQPLWVRGLKQTKVHMVWYAQNWRPLAYIDNPLVADLPQLRWIKADTHWVWTKAFAAYLESLWGGGESIEVVGPIVWQLPEISTPRCDAIEIVIFDTPALSDEANLRYAGEITNYYAPENLCVFIRDVIALKPMLEARFLLPVFFKVKSKRRYSPVYVKDYFDYLERLSAQGKISLVDPSANIYAVASSGRLVIMYPFSTAGYIAEALKLPSVFYDPTHTVLRQDFCDEPERIQFANSPDQLLEIAISMLSNVVAIQ